MKKDETVVSGSLWGKLRFVHFANALLVLLLTGTGILLFLPSFRSDFPTIRVYMKNLHIFLGILSISLLLFHSPFLYRYVTQLRYQRMKRYNVYFVSALIVGWTLTGFILWRYRSLPPMASNISLWIHDLLTWIGVPYAVYHSLTRMQWLKSVSKLKRGVSVDPSHSSSVSAAYKSRRAFIKSVLGLCISFSVFPYFLRWMKTSTFMFNAEDLQKLQDMDQNHMLPVPVASQAAAPSIGGIKGSFRVYSVVEPLPVFTSDSWQLTITGLVGEPLTLSWEQLLKLPRKMQKSDFHCITGWSVYNCTWEGVSLAELLNMVEPSSKANFVKFFSGDGVYTDSLSLEQAGMEDVMVAFMLANKPIPHQLGGPVRLIVPRMYAYKSVKWLTEIQLIKEDYFGYWEQRGYYRDGWVHLGPRIGPKDDTLN